MNPEPPAQGHGPAHDQPEPPKIQPRTIALSGAVLLLTLAVLFVVGFWLRHKRVVHREEMAEETRSESLVVTVVNPRATQKSYDLTLPADVRAWATTALYARTNGYLASWTFDINDRVRKGDVMAVISAPDTDAELEQAKAALNQAQTNARLATATDERFKGLIPVQGVTQEQLDQNQAAREQAAAGVQSAAADVDRLEALVGFEKIVAPFDGVVTVRTYDLGALVSATNIGAGQELFDVAEDDKLRVFVSVPQPDSQLIRYGQPVDLVLERNFPGHRFSGIVARSSGSLDPVTRTLRTELDFENEAPPFRMLPGMYAEAVFHITRDKPVLTVPTSAMLFEAEGKEVAVVGPDNKIHLQKIVPGSDFGTEIEVLSGLKITDRVVRNPGEQLAEGVTVTVAPGPGPQTDGAGGS